MDISVLASVGSFVMSERVLKPKASVLAVLGCFLAYDLTTKTHDPSSLRVYRGPALMAFTLIMAAFSLRTWRRNGIACDELIFLPGTPHGERHGVDTTDSVSHIDLQQSRSRSPDRGERSNGEADIAAGVSPSSPGSGVELGPIPAAKVKCSSTPLTKERFRSRSSVEALENSVGSSAHEFAYSWDDDEEPETTRGQERHGCIDEEDEEAALNVILDGTSQADSRAGQGSDRLNNLQNINSSGSDAWRFQEARPRITRIGSFFFFRSSVTSTHSADYAPSGPSVVGAAIDLSIPTLFNFHLFIEAYNHIDSYGSETPAKILPLIFLSVLIVRTVIPPGRRGRFWSIMRYTFMAPFHQVRFRDAFIGDFLTSLVRPLQDILFALSYYVTTIYGISSGNMSLAESGDTLESSWLLHNVALPSCALLPLWWKFLQTLRQSYDTGNRWPHLGNAFKYLSASLIILYGMTHPENRRATIWVVSFVLCVLYQIWWDVVMDWDLIVIAPRGQDESVGFENSWCAPRASFQANSYLLYLNMVFLQPFKDLTRWFYNKVPRLSQVQLRARRLYKGQAFYWRILAYNVVFRFAWMLCFIPAYRLSPSGREHVTTFSSDTNSYVGVLLPVAEILRRTFWGFLLLEKETIRMQDGDTTGYSRLTMETDDASEEISIDSAHGKVKSMLSWLGNQQQPQQDGVLSSCFAWLNDMLTFSEDTVHKLFVLELSAWAVAFVGFGLWTTS